MCHANRRSTYIMLAVAAAAVAAVVVFDLSPVLLLFTVFCPLMMLVMMLMMGGMGMGGHVDHGTADDALQRDEHLSPDRGGVGGRPGGS